jgi:hypothetical protein
MTDWTRGAWSKGLTEWTDGDTAYLSVAFTWKLPEAHDRARWYKAMGMRVVAGGGAFYTRPAYLDDVAEVPREIRMVDGRPKLILGAYPGAVARHNPMATKASEGCPVGCWFCVVPAIEGLEFTFLPDFEPRPILTDNNLSALPADYQQHIVDRYIAAGVPLLDANSGFEPKTFDGDVFERWSMINKGPWRFALDETGELEDASRVIQMLKQRGVGGRQIQVYVMIGHEPFEQCMERIHRVIALGGEPYVQPVMKLNALVREKWIRHDWTDQKLTDVARWANRKQWRKIPFSEYRAGVKTVDSDRYDGQTGLFD